MIEIIPIGGYNEVGKNCTAINIDGTVIICDMGIQLEKYIQFTDSEEEDVLKIGAHALMQAGAIPDVSKIDHLRKQVAAIIPTHAHLDHIGAIPFLSNKFNCPIYCTPFTKAVIDAIVSDMGMTLKNHIKVLSGGARYKLTKDITIEFVDVTHSTPDTVMIAIHTKYGVIMYANDFKLDNNPIVGKRPDYARMEQLGKQGVLALIHDSLYSKDPRKTPSESVAKEMLKDVMLGTDSKDNLIIATTFASHLARLKSMIDNGRAMNRKILFLGRSLAKYVQAGEKVGLIKFSDKVEIIKYGNKIEKRLKKIKDSERGKYMLVMTGHQGEPKAVLSRIADKIIDFELKPEDHVIFSCQTIPTPTNIENRRVLEDKLRRKKVRIFTDIHVSGHAAREDLRDVLHMLKPQHIIPAHGDESKRAPVVELALELGYDRKNVHLIGDGTVLKL